MVDQLEIIAREHDTSVAAIAPSLALGQAGRYFANRRLRAVSLSWKTTSRRST
ncbi:MAG: hypothetical protein WDM85_01695 [Caulobacteraceae bacterium]